MAHTSPQMIENVARGGHPRTVPHAKMSSKGHTELQISLSRAKIDEEVAGDVRFCVAPQKTGENIKKHLFVAKNFREKSFSASKNETSGIV